MYSVIGFKLAGNNKRQKETNKKGINFLYEKERDAFV